MSSPYPVVAAIDFGTHGTGYAWTEVANHRSDGSGPTPQIRDRWPGSDGYYPKDLSAVLLDPAGQIAAWGHEAKREWARRSASGETAGYGYASAFKMALKPDSYRGVAAPGAGSVVIDSVTKAYPLVVACLRRVYQLALDEITKSGYLEKQIRWCLTVPAIWDDEQKQLMRDAAAEAGMPADRDRLLLAIEPEVAAVHCRTHLARVLGSRSGDGGRIAEAGSRFMVVDCGGGTVDITAYRVDAAGRMSEIGKVSGGKLGSEYINQAFIDQILRDRFGGPEVIDRIRRERPAALLELVDGWESQKVTATVRAGENGSGPVIERPVYLSIPPEIREMLPAPVVERLARMPGGSPHRLVVTAEEATRLFASVVDHLVELVDEQLGEMVEHDGRGTGTERLLLVGGLSQSEYVQQRLLGYFGARASVMVPPNPAAAVLFGAVQYGCATDVIVERRARYTYGCNSAMAYEAGTDPVVKKVLNSDGNELCQDRFHVFAVIGQSIRTDHVTDETFFPIRDDQTVIQFDFYRTTSPTPRYIDEPASERIGTLTIELGTAMSLPLPQRDVDLRWRFGDTDISVQGTNRHNGRQVSTSLRFDAAG